MFGETFLTVKQNIEGGEYPSPPSKFDNRLEKLTSFSLRLSNFSPPLFQKKVFGFKYFTLMKTT